MFYFENERGFLLMEDAQAKETNSKLTMEQQQILTDRIVLKDLLQDANRTMCEFSAKMPDKHRRDFRKAYERHAKHYAREFGKLLDRSIQFRPTTHIGLTCAALFHRSIGAYKYGVETANQSKAIEEGTRLLRLLTIFDASSENVNQDLASGLAQAGFFNAQEVKPYGK